jgi:hypothetical protein
VASSTSGFPVKIFYAFLNPLHAKCPTHLILLDLSIIIISGEEYNYGAPQYAVLSSLLTLHPS